MEQFDQSCPADIVLPASTARLLLTRAAERWGAAARVNGPDMVVTWPNVPATDDRPNGCFAVRWNAPHSGEATICELGWNRERGSADLVRRAINSLAGYPVAWGHTAQVASASANRASAA